METGLGLLGAAATALALGNCVILNSPANCSGSAAKLVGMGVDAGMPNGVLQAVHGDSSLLDGFCEHPNVAAVVFSGSSARAQDVYSRCQAAKRVVAFGGAKNHVFALPDCHVGALTRDVASALTAQAGQRAFAPSVLVLVGDGSEQVRRAFLDVLVQEVVTQASRVEAGQKPGQMGPLASETAKDRYRAAISTWQSQDLVTDRAVACHVLRFFQGSLVHQ